MERLKIVFSCSILLLLYNCGVNNSTKFYESIILNDKETKKDIFPDASIYYGKKEFGDPDKKAFYLLKKQLKNTKHIYYTYIPEVRGLLYKYTVNIYVYDVENDVSYLIREKDSSSNELELAKMDEYDTFRNDFIISQIKNNDCDSIHKIKREFSNEVGQVVYDINLKEKTISRCSFNHLSLITEYVESIRKNRKEQ